MDNDALHSADYGGEKLVSNQIMVEHKPIFPRKLECSRNAKPLRLSYLYQLKIIKKYNDEILIF